MSNTLQRETSTSTLHHRNHSVPPIPPPLPPARREPTWPGEHLPVPRRTIHLRRLMVQEVSSVLLWLFSCHCLLFTLKSLTSMAQGSGLLSFLAGYVLMVLPRTRVPGFVTANVLVLLCLQTKTGSLPNLAFRVAEYRLGRLTKRELAVVMAVHIGLVYSVSQVVRQSQSLRLPTRYCTTTSVDLLHEVLLLVGFCTAMGAVPVLLRLNHLPTYLTLVLVYPLYNATTSGGDEGCTTSSTLSPVILLLGSTVAWSRFAAQIVGGWLAGEVMDLYFPDDP